MTARSVTVLMTVHNGEPYVKEAVRSILQQTYDNYTFLILDNASTDRTREVIRDFQDPRIELIELDQDLGQTGALNHGLKLADTPYIARMDADDISHPSRLEQQMRFLEGHPQIALLGAWYEVIDGEDQTIDRIHLPAEHTEILKGMLFENQFAHSAVIYNRQVALACGGYSPRYKFCQDFALWWQISLNYTVANLPEVLVQIREHLGQTTRTFNIETTMEPTQVVKDVLDNAKLPENMDRLKCKARGYANLKHAVGFSLEGHQLRSFFCIVRGLCKAPALLIDRATVNYIALILLGKRRYAILRNLKRSLSLCFAG